jgi:hypothetical protein
MTVCSFDTVVKYVEGTETTTGLKVRADLKHGANETGECVSRRCGGSELIRMPSAQYEFYFRRSRQVQRCC